MSEIAQNKKGSSLFSTLFLYRRLIFAAEIVLLDDATIQVLATNICSLVYTIYLVVVRPKNSGWLNATDIINEIFFMTINLVVLCFTEYVPDPLKRHEIGVFYIVLVYLTLALNFIGAFVWLIVS